MKRFLILAFLLVLPILASADTITPLAPATPASTSYTAFRTFDAEEDARRLGLMFHGFITTQSACQGITAAGLTHTPSSCTAVTDGGWYVAETGGITYAMGSDPDTCWVILHKDTTGNVASFVRVSGTHYLIDCTSGARPATPADSLMIMEVTLSGSPGAITAVDNELAPRVPYLLEGPSFVDIREFGAACNGAADDTTTVTHALEWAEDNGDPMVVIPWNCVWNENLVTMESRNRILDWTGEGPRFISSGGLFAYVRDMTGIAGSSAQIQLYVGNSDGVPGVPLAQLQAVYVDPTAGSEDSYVQFTTLVNGATEIPFIATGNGTVMVGSGAVQTDDGVNVGSGGLGIREDRANITNSSLSLVNLSTNDASGVRTRALLADDAGTPRTAFLIDVTKVDTWAAAATADSLAQFSVLLAGSATSVLELDGSVSTIRANWPVRLPTFTQATLPGVVDGSLVYCSDCVSNADPSDACAGASTGAFAKRVNGAWQCD